MQSVQIGKKAASPAVLLCNALLFFAMGLITLTNEELALRFASYAGAVLLVLSGISQMASYWNSGKRFWALLAFSLFLLLAASLYFFSWFYALSLGALFGIWFLLLGIVRGLIFLQCQLEGLMGRSRNLIASLLSLGFGAGLLLHPDSRLHSVTRLAGIYFLLYAFTLLTDFFSELLQWDLVTDKLKRRVRIAFPTFLTAFIPGRLIDRFNAYFREHGVRENVISAVNAPEGRERVDLEVFIHLWKGGFNNFGHVDICYGGLVYSYGCYDQHSHRFFGLVSDGTLAVVPREPYLAHCLTFEKKILVGFGLCLSEAQKKAVESRLKELSALSLPWKCDLQRMEAGELPLGEYRDAASELWRATGAKIYKIASGPFRTYFAVNTNCVQLADTIIGSSGIDVLSINGISTPGGYYALLDELFQRKNTIVVRKNVYKESTDRKKKAL